MAERLWALQYEPPVSDADSATAAEHSLRPLRAASLTALVAGLARDSPAHLRCACAEACAKLGCTRQGADELERRFQKQRPVSIVGGFHTLGVFLSPTTEFLRAHRELSRVPL